MSRGGRGGGRGGFGGGGGNKNGIPQFAINAGLTLSVLGDKRGAGMTFATAASGDPVKGMSDTIVRGGLGLYPPVTNLPKVEPPTTEESRILNHKRRLARTYRNSPYRLVASEKRTGADLEFYRDKYNSEKNTNVHGMNAEALSMKEEYFPEVLWAGYFDPQRRIIAARAEAAAKPRLKVDDIDVDGADDFDKASSRSGQSDEENFAELDEDDEELEGDYGNQYFDNGEGDDQDDLGGGGGGDDD